MAIHAIIGVLGAGKGRHYAAMFMRDLRESQRVIMTNFAIELMPWVNGEGQVQLGLLSYLKYRLNSDDLVKQAMERVFRVPDEIMPEFFLYRAVLNENASQVKNATLYLKGTKFSLYKAQAIYKTVRDEKKVVSFDLELLPQWPMHTAIDEAWKFWPAREWDSTTKAVLFYAAHCRKTGDELWLTTHSTKDLDSALIRKVQDYHLCINRGKRSIFGFAQPRDIKVTVTTNVPTGTKNDNVMRTYSHKINPDGIAEIYDTTGGVGILGRMKGDLKEKPPGLPFWVLITLIIGGIFLACMTGFIALRTFQNKANKKFNEVVHGTQSTNAAAQTPGQRVANYFVQRGQDYASTLQRHQPSYYSGSGSRMIQTNILKCTGYAIIGGKPQAFLDDGTVLESDELLAVKKWTVETTNKDSYRIKIPMNKVIQNQYSIPAYLQNDGAAESLLKQSQSQNQPRQLSTYESERVGQ